MASQDSDATAAGITAGSAVFVTLYGVLVLLADVAFGEELFPESDRGVGLLLLVILLAGAAVGGALGRLRP